jgi:hypothetical protein
MPYAKISPLSTSNRLLLELADKPYADGNLKEACRAKFPLRESAFLRITRRLRKVHILAAAPFFGRRMKFVLQAFTAVLSTEPHRPRKSTAIAVTTYALAKSALARRFNYLFDLRGAACALFVPSTFSRITTWL